jgi:hypothetical protein
LGQFLEIRANSIEVRCQISVGDDIILDRI